MLNAEYKYGVLVKKPNQNGTTDEEQWREIFDNLTSDMNFHLVQRILFQIVKNFQKNQAEEMYINFNMSCKRMITWKDRENGLTESNCDEIK